MKSITKNQNAMIKSLSFILIVSLVISCTSKTRKVDLQTKIKKDTTISSEQILFAAPQLIDSSSIVIYPLILEKGTYGSGYGSGSRGGITSYWNIIFYNTETGKRHLLTNDLKMLIYSITFGSNSSSSYSSDIRWTQGIDIFKDMIFYSVISNDYDKNDRLDDKDPVYLYVSNKDGTNFRKISPDNYNITSWNVIKGTSKVIMMGQKDDNADKLFNNDDGHIPLIADLSSNQQATEVFNPGYLDSLSQKLLSTWKE